MNCRGGPVNRNPRGGRGTRGSRVEEQKIRGAEARCGESRGVSMNLPMKFTNLFRPREPGYGPSIVRWETGVRHRRGFTRITGAHRVMLVIYATVSRDLQASLKIAAHPGPRARPNPGDFISDAGSHRASPNTIRPRLSDQRRSPDSVARLARSAAHEVVLNTSTATVVTDNRSLQIAWK